MTTIVLATLLAISATRAQPNAPVPPQPPTCTTAACQLFHHDTPTSPTRPGIADPGTTECSKHFGKLRERLKQRFQKLRTRTRHHDQANPNSNANPDNVGPPPPIQPLPSAKT